MDTVKWTLEVEEDPNTGDLVLPFPPDLLANMGWKEGDTLKWEDNGDGSFSLINLNQSGKK